MATESIVSTPRIDRKFVDPQGNLTRNAYALLYGLVTRTGGSVGVVIDAPSLQESIDALCIAPVCEPITQGEQFIPPPTVYELSAPQDARLSSLEAEVARLAGEISALQQVPA